MRSAGITTGRRRIVATLLRVLILCSAGLCLVFVAMCRWWPEPIDDLARAYRDSINQSYLQRWTESLGLSPDSTELKQNLSDLAFDLAEVRKLDRLAAAVRIVERRLIDVALKTGDRQEALTHAHRLYTFDPRDLQSVALLGKILGADPETRAQSVQILRRAQERVPDSPVIVPVYCKVLLDSGDLTQAARVMLRAAIQPQSHVWHVQWSERSEHVAWFMPRNLGGGMIEARFRIDSAIEGMRLRLPPFASMDLSKFCVRIESGSSDQTYDMLDLRTELASVRVEDSAHVLFGSEAPSIHLPELSSITESTTVTISAVRKPTMPEWLAGLFAGSVGRRLAKSSSIEPEVAGQFAKLYSEVTGR